MKTIECRGLDINECSLTIGLKVTAKDSGKVFENVNVTDGDWYDFDEEGNQSIGISSIECKIKRI